MADFRLPTADFALSVPSFQFRVSIFKFPFSNRISDRVAARAPAA
jgi:hypothetical protein